MILAGDIGGTSARLALFEPLAAGRLAPRIEETYRSREFDGLASIVRLFVATHRPAVSRACFGIAGPVRNGAVTTPNLPWTVEARAIASALAVPEVDLINDLEANAWGIGALGPADVLTLQAGRADAEGNRAVLSAGTGLGMAGLYWDGRRHRPFASEGGHADFAPRNALEADLLEFARRRWDHVSIERMVSGPAFVLIYEFLLASGRCAEPAAVTRRVRERMGAGDASAVITASALSGESPLARAAVDLFVSIYGAAAGNLALTMMATGGLYIGGGIAPRIVERLRTPGFLDAFRDKGRLRPLLESVPVHVILNSKTALLGAGRFAAARINEGASE